MRLNEDVFLTTYFNSFDRKMAYQLMDKEPKTLRDAFKMAYLQLLKVHGELCICEDANWVD